MQLITDEAFDLMYTYLCSERMIHCKNRKAMRRFLEAIFWMSRSGAQWRFLPKEYGSWNSVYKRFSRWSELGVWRRMFHYFSRDADMEWLLIDSTIVRAHACAAGAKGGANGRRLAVARAVLQPKSMSR